MLMLILVRVLELYLTHFSIKYKKLFLVLFPSVEEMGGLGM